MAKTQGERKDMQREVAPFTSVTFDTDLYGVNNGFEGYDQSIPVHAGDDENLEAMASEIARKLASYTAPKWLLKEMQTGGDKEEDSSGFRRPSRRIIDREDDYRRRRLNRVLSPDRHDPFASGDKTPDASVRTYADVMREEAFKRQKDEFLRNIAKKKEEEEEREAVQRAKKKTNRWDQSQEASDWDMLDSTPGIGRWDDDTPVGGIELATPSPGAINLTPEYKVGERYPRQKQAFDR